MRRLWSSNISIIISAKANLRVALFPQINSGEEGYFPILPPDGTDFCCRSKITSAAGCRSPFSRKLSNEIFSHCPAFFQLLCVLQPWKQTDQNRLYVAVHFRIDPGQFAVVRNGLPGISGEILCKGHIKRDLQPNQSQKYFGLFFQLLRPVRARMNKCQ